MTWAILFSALSIFVLRIADVSLGTLRIVTLVRGQRRLAGALGFGESIIWLLAAGQVLSNLDSPLKIVAYAGGYAAGTMFGSTIERWLAMGKTLMRIVSPVDSPQVSEALRAAGFFVTVINAEGRDGEVRISFSVIPRKRAEEAVSIVSRVNKKAFVTFEETSTIDLAVLPAARVRK